MFSTPYAGLPAAADRLVEILDQQGHPLLLMPIQTASARNMPHRVALASLRDRGGRLWLARRPRQTPGHPHCWDFAARGPVLAGEAGADAAARLLKESLGLPDAQPVPQAVLPPLAFEGARRCILFTAVQRGGQVSSRAEGMFVDKDELAGLAEHFPDLLSMCLLWCVQNNKLLEYSGCRIQDEDFPTIPR
jgi:isopentenyldiphosphate isomerase